MDFDGALAGLQQNIKKINIVNTASKKTIRLK